MNKLIPSFLKRFDAWLLGAFPKIWATQIHIFLFFSLIVVNIIVATVAFLMPVSLAQFPNFKKIGDVSVFLAIIGFFLTIYWFWKMKAKLITTTYWKSLLSYLLCFVMIGSLIFNISLYDKIIKWRTTKLLPKETVEKDAAFLAVTYLMCTNTGWQDSLIEDVRFDHTTIKKEQLKATIGYNYTHSFMMSKLEYINDSFPNDFGNKDWVIKKFRTVPLDSTDYHEIINPSKITDRMIAANYDYYEKRYSHRHEKNRVIDDDYDGNKEEDTYASEYYDILQPLYERYEINNEKYSDLIRKNYQILDFQQDSILYHDSFNGDLSWVFPQIFNEYNKLTERSGVIITQNRVDDFANFLSKNESFKPKAANYNITWLLTILACMLYHCRLKDSVITVITSLIVGFAIVFIPDLFVNHYFHKQIIGIFCTFSGAAILLTRWGWFGLRSMTRWQRIVQIALWVFMLMITLLFTIVLDKDDSAMGIWKTIVANAHYGYCLLVPAMITLYHRLGTMPKYR